MTLTERHSVQLSYQEQEVSNYEDSQRNIRTIPASHPKKTASYGKQKKKKAEPHFDQQSVYQEPGYHDFPDDFSADNYSDHTDMVPLDKDSIMS